jgi:hypothetical protein
MVNHIEREREKQLINNPLSREQTNFQESDFILKEEEYTKPQ